MKKIFLFLFLSIITASAFAQYGTMTVSSVNNQKFWLFIDDVLQNEYSTNIIRIQGLQSTYYKIRVEMDNPSNSCVGETVLISTMSGNNNYVVTKEKGNYYSFKKGQISVNPFFIQNVIVPDYSYYSGYNQFLFPGFNPNANYGQDNHSRGSAYKKYQYSNQGNSHGYGGNQGYGNPPAYSTPPPPPAHGNPLGYGNSGYGNSGYGSSGYGNLGYGTGCMPVNDFNRALATIQKESFEDSKLKVARQVTSNNRLCVSQIIQICRIFSFEAKKLEYAKYAYRYCADQNNYYQINDVFSFTASKDELRKYIEGRSY